MPEVEQKYVFISYVREDSDRVDVLCRALEAAQIPYWRDRKNLGPGDAWRSKIREAVSAGSIVFVACFSKHSLARSKSYMNEELTLAVDEYRKRAPGRTWLIPVRLDDVTLDAWDLGAGRTLGDLHYADLFGEEFAPNLAGLIATISRVLGDRAMSVSTALAAVEQTTRDDRTRLLRSLAKDMLLDPARQIALDELVSQETLRVTSRLGNPNGYKLAEDMDGDAQVLFAAQASQNLWREAEGFCSTLQVAARWSSPDKLTPWANGIQAMAQSALRLESGNTALLATRQIPGVMAIMTAGVACVAARQWMNLKALVLDPVIRDRSGRELISPLDALSPYSIFESDWVANTVARSTVESLELKEALDALTGNKVGKYFTPVAEWAHALLRPMFQDQIIDSDAYDFAFDRAEVFLGVLAIDSANSRRGAAQDGRYVRVSHWYGRSAWRAGRYGNSVEEISMELDAQGERWAPLVGGLFGGDPERAAVALAAYRKDFERSASRYW